MSGRPDPEGSEGRSSGKKDLWGARGTAGVSFASTLRFDGVGLSLGGRPVLADFSLELAPGEIVCLLGESGSGKSSALRIAAGLQAIDGGQVLINDQIVTRPGFRTPPETRGVGLMFQDFALFPHLTVLQNVTFGLRSLGRRGARQHALATLRRVGLNGREDDYPHMLSGGQQQRLALARTVAPRPGIILLDEPFSGLDARMRQDVRAETHAVLRETHATTLIVTHDPEEAMLLGDRIALLDHGRIIQADTAAKIYSSPASLRVARFFSGLTEIECVVRDKRVETPFGPVPAHDFADGASVRIGIRPVGAVSISSVGEGASGRILSRREALGTEIYEVQVDTLDGPIEVRQHFTGDLPPGSDVKVQLHPQHVLVFAAE